MKSNYISKLIYTILKNNEDSRDDMMLVVKSIHDFELSVLGKDKSEYYECCFSGKLASIKTIDRIWRKIMEHNPELRGEEWDERQIYSRFVSRNIVMERYGQINMFK
jgi:hypothetical protein